MDSIYRTDRRVWLGAAGFLALHGALAVLLPLRLAPLSTLCIVLAEAAALCGCVREARAAAARLRVLWWLLGLAMLLQAFGVSMDMVAEALGAPASLTPRLPVLFATLYTVPLLLAVSMQLDPETKVAVRGVYAGLALATGLVFFMLVFSVTSREGNSEPGGVQFVSNLFDGLDVFLAVAATTRALGSDEVRERAYFYVVSLFLWVNMLLPAVHNRILMQHDFVWLDVLISAPYLLLTALIFHGAPRLVRESRPSVILARLVRSGSPMFLSLGLLALGIVLSRRHFREGACAVVGAILCYGALNVMAQSEGMATEDSLLASKRELERLVGVDGLTGIANRRMFDRTLQRACRSADRSGQPVALLMLDVDYFKQINDAGGHVRGDEYLVRLARMLRDTLPRANDLVARFGGEEFAVILPATGAEGASIVANRVHRAVAELGLEHPGSPTGRITVSIGVAASNDLPETTPIMLLRAADRALYKAKQRGRSRTELFRLEPAPATG